MVAKKISYKKSSGNVYDDLGFLDAEEHLAKAKLALRIEEIIAERGLNQKHAAEVLGINQPKVSALINGKLAGFSMERLLHFLNLLDQDIEIIVKNRPKRRTKVKHGRLQVAFV